MTTPRLLDTVEALYCDLDGVVYLGAEPVPEAVEALTRAAERGTRVAYLTNNASRTPDEVAGQLRGLGLHSAQADDVVTSAQACPALLQEASIPAGAAVLVVGGLGLRQAVAGAGYRIVTDGDEHPAAVVQGFAPEVGWRELAEASFAIQAGAVWIGSNDDRTIPRERGLAPGNGTLIAAVAAATGSTPVLAGKPHAPIYRTAAERFGVRRALAIGDRLDTDIEGANRAGIASALVLTGTDREAPLFAAEPARRPRYVLDTLSDLFAPVQNPEVDDSRATCGEAEVELEGGRLRVRRPGRHADRLLAAAALIWASGVDHRQLRLDADLGAGF